MFPGDYGKYSSSSPARTGVGQCLYLFLARCGPRNSTLERPVENVLKQDEYVRVGGIAKLSRELTSFAPAATAAPFVHEANEQAVLANDFVAGFEKRAGGFRRVRWTCRHKEMEAEFIERWVIGSARRTCRALHSTRRFRRLASTNGRRAPSTLRRFPYTNTA